MSKSTVKSDATIKITKTQDKYITYSIEYSDTNYKKGYHIDLVKIKNGSKKRLEVFGYEIPNANRDVEATKQIDIDKATFLIVAELAEVLKQTMEAGHEIRI